MYYCTHYVILMSLVTTHGCHCCLMKQFRSHIISHTPDTRHTLKYKPHTYYKPCTRYKTHLKVQVQGIQQSISHIILQIEHAVAMVTGRVEVVNNYNTRPDASGIMRQA